MTKPRGSGRILLKRPRHCSTPQDHEVNHRDTSSLYVSSTTTGISPCVIRLRRCTNTTESVTHEEMKANKIPLEYRDRCARLLIPLTKCRRENYFMPWSCGEERHNYEKCQYMDFQRRVKEMEELKAQRDAEKIAAKE